MPPRTQRGLRALLVADPRDQPHVHLVRVALLAAGVPVAFEAGLADAVEVAAADAFDVVVVAASRPMETTAVIRSIAGLPATPPLVLIAATAHVLDVAEVVAAGACCYLLESMASRDLARALRCAALGKTVVPRDVVAQVAEQLRRDGAARGNMLEGPLTRRERQVLLLVREGLCTREIAERLFISPVTVRSHLVAIRRKLREPQPGADALTGSA